MNKLGTKLGALALSAVMALTFAPSAAITALAAPADTATPTIAEADSSRIQVWRLKNKANNSHFFTSNQKEYTYHVITAADYVEEANGGWYGAAIGSSEEDVERWNNPSNNEHLLVLASNTGSRTALQAAGWVNEGVVFGVPEDGDITINRWAYPAGVSIGDGHLYFRSDADYDEEELKTKFGMSKDATSFKAYSKDETSEEDVALTGVTIDNTTPKVGDTLTAITLPLDAVVTYQWYADGTAITDADDDELLVTNDMLGKKIKVKVTALDGETVTSEETAAVEYVYPEIKTAIQNSANSFTASFDSDASEIVKADDIEVISEDLTDVKKITGLDFSLDGKSAVVTVSTSFKDGVTYNVNYQESTASFEASVGEVASVVIKTNQAEVNTTTKIEFALIDENGIDVTSDVKVDEHCTVSFEGDYSDYTNTRASNSTVIMGTVGDTCTVTVEYDKNDGVTEKVSASKDITCVAAVEKAGIPFFKADPDDTNDTDDCYRFYDPSNSTDTVVKVAIDDDALVHFYAQDTDGSAISYDAYEIESADETVANVEIGEHANGKWADFTVTGNTKGNVLLTLTAEKNGAQTTYDIPVVVTEAPYPNKVTLTPTKKTMTNAWDDDYSGEIKKKVTNNDGTTADEDTYTFGGFELITTNKSIDSDLKDTDTYGTTYIDAFEDGDAGFQLTDAGIYTAFAAEGGSYVIEGSVTDNSSGKVLSARCTVTVEELSKDAWVADPGDAAYGIYGPADFEDGDDEDELDDTTGLTEAEKAALGFISQTEYTALPDESVLPGVLVNVPELAEAYGEYEAADEWANGGYNLFTKDENGDYVLIDDNVALEDAAMPDNEAGKEPIYKATMTGADAPEDFDATDPTTYGDNAITTLTDDDLFETAPEYTATLILGKDAYQQLVTFPVGKGVYTEYKIELDTDLSFVSDNDGTARLVATMGGKFAGYVHADGSIGEGYVVANDATKIVNAPAFGRTVEIQTYFGKEIVGETEDVGETVLFGMANGGERGLAPAKNGDGVLEQNFYTVNGIPELGILDYYTDSKDQLTRDDDYARVGTYKVVFSYWNLSSTKAIEKSANMKVTNDLYVPTVTVKSQYLDSYTQDGWKDAVISEVDLNNNNPATYSVVALVDKNGTDIADAKTPAKWALVTEEGTIFHIPLNRTFKLN